MSEEDKKEEDKKKPKTDDSGDGDKPKTNTLLDDTNLAAKRLEDATKAAKEERLEAEDSYHKMKLGGGSEAGVAVEKKEENPKEYNDRIAKEISEGKHDE